MKNKKRILVLFSLLLFAGFVLSGLKCAKQVAFALPSAVQTSAKGMVLIEENSLRVLQEKNKDEKLPMASTTKIMTAYSVLKRCENLDTVVKVSPLSVGIEGTSMYLKKGNEYTIKDLLYGMMIVSGNDASVALALHFAGSIKEFADIMTNDAKELGLKNTSFKNPHGLDEKGHYTTAYDLAVITAHAMKFDFFKETVKQKSVMVTEKNTPDKVQLLINKNKLLGAFKQVTGVKIGFTDAAGRCLVASGEDNGLKLISVVLNCPDMFLDSKNLLEFGFTNYVHTNLLESYKIHRKVQIEEGREKEIKIYTKREFSYPLTLDESFEIKFEYAIDENLKAPIEKEQVVGKYKILLNDELLFETPLYSFEQIKSDHFLEYLKDVLSHWI
ncbi:MAG: D-alanyl-D-alanine carboxypeptidase family protein [Christensenellales bacterium]|jgi:D-alanyl-D-alanine carboxypeptidase (penicillin-binding protein 5/6)